MRKTTMVILSTLLIALISSLFYLNKELIRIEGIIQDIESIQDVNIRTLQSIQNYLIKDAVERYKNQIVDHQ